MIWVCRLIAKSDRKDRQLYDFGMPLKNPILTTHAKEGANERGIAWGDRTAMRFVKGTHRNLVATMYHWERRCVVGGGNQGLQEGVHTLNHRPCRTAMGT